MFSPVPGVAVPTTGLKAFGFQRTAEHVHRGIDLTAPCGTPVVSVCAGVVERAHGGDGPAAGFSGYGRVVVVRQRADGPWFLYAHLRDVIVAPGQVVRRGEPIATVGDTCFRTGEPNARCGCHLHFEVSPNPYPQDAEAERLDPVAWLRAARAHEAIAHGFSFGRWVWRPSL